MFCKKNSMKPRCHSLNDPRILKLEGRASGLWYPNGSEKNSNGRAIVVKDYQRKTCLL